MSENEKNVKKISVFRNEYAFLSNFYPCTVNFEGLTYRNTEAAFQAQKCSSEEDKVKYTLIKNPVRAKQMGKKEPNLPANWGELSLEVMLGVLRAKFAVPELAEKLLATGDAELVEGNTHHDNLWGNCTCPKCVNKVGQNRLGKLLMQVRKELREHV